MLVVHEWLKDYIGKSIPSVEEIEELLTFHAFEIEGTKKEGKHTVIDIDVLPNRSSDCLSHRGIAREIAALAGIQLENDPFLGVPPFSATTEKIAIDIENEKACARFSAALMTGLTVKESPDWLKERLTAIGQRPINNIVDATNYVMFALGQPLHAYDADKLEQKDGRWHLGARMAKDGERVKTLAGEEYELDPGIQLIVNGANDMPLGIAGIKGGKQAEIDEKTSAIIIEAANFDPAVTRKASQQLRLQTDASKRFENDISPGLIPYALKEVVALLEEIGGGTCEGYADVYPRKTKNTEVTVTLEHINNLLGLSLSKIDVSDIFNRLGFTITENADSFSVTAPFERTDIAIPEDVIEEVGRVYGYEHVISVVPERIALTEVNVRQYYSEKIRDLLTGKGFSEVITSTFRKKDEIKLQNALASDKGCLRSLLSENIKEVLDKNIQNADLLGLRDIRVFEIGTVFKKGENGVAEHVSVALGVRTKQQGHDPKDDKIATEALSQLCKRLGIAIEAFAEQGIIEFDLSALLTELPVPKAYEQRQIAAEVQYKPFSSYPFISRDIALWVPEGTPAADIEETLNECAGELRVRTTLFDEFKKDGRVSYAFRLVFQSHERTLTDSEVNTIMDRITSAVSERGWEVR